MKKQLVVVLIIAMSFVLISCKASNVNNSETVHDGIIVSQASTFLGGESADITRVTYRINLWNKLGKAVSIKTVEPIISKDIQDRLIDQNISIQVDKEIESNESLEISGSFSIDTNGLSKEEIINLEIRITEFKILTEQIIGNKQ